MSYLTRKARKGNNNPHETLNLSRYFICDGRFSVGIIKPVDNYFVAHDPDGEIVGTFRSLVAAVRALPHGGEVCSLALQNGVQLETIRRALLRDSHGRPSTPLSAALDIIFIAADGGMP